MNVRFIIIFIISIITVNCFSLPVKFNTILTKDQEAILKKTTEILGFGFGYDSDIDIDYIFSYSHSKMDQKKREIEFSQIIENIDIDTIKALHERIYWIYSMTMYRLDRYKSKKQWKYHTFIKIELLPPLKRYMDLLQVFIFRKEPSYKISFNKKKSFLDEDVRRYYIKKNEIPNIFEEPIDENFIIKKTVSTDIDKQDMFSDIFDEQVSNADNTKFLKNKDFLESDIADTF
ncbi:MAG: hypothetical protein SVR08_06760 [Spirochaetota bacterium]|nr:hypothetical protein [Spirochaetota bacterium]